MSGERGPRESLLLPLLIPIAALAVIGLALFGFSRILLQVSATAATVTALIAASGIMTVASVVASRKETGGPAILSLVGGVLGIAMLAGGGALLLGQPPEEGEGPLVVALAIPVDGATEGFSQTKLTAPADQPFVIELTSEDPVTHNVDLSDSADAPPFVSGPDVLGPGASVRVDVEALEAGEYHFFCKYHPTTMTGTLTTEESVAPPGEPEGITVVASGIAFDTDEIDLPADTPTTITFDNADAGTTHNIAIYTDDTASDVIFDGADVVGPASIPYDVPAIEAGEYYFHCDTHPIMAGTVVVDGKEGGGGGGDGAPPPPEESGAGPPEPDGG